MTCDSRADAVTEAAVSGAPIEPDLAAHLRQCAGCRRTLENTRAVLVRIDGEVEAALDVEPADALVERVRAALPVQPAERPRWTTRVLLPAGLAAAFAGSFFAAHRERPVEISPSLPAEVAARPQETAPAHGADGIAVPALHTAATRAPARTRGAHPVRDRPPEVLVAAGQAAALRMLVEGSRQGRVDASGLLAPRRVAEPAETTSLSAELLPETALLIIAPSPLEIAPLTLEPLNEEG